MCSVGDHAEESAVEAVQTVEASRNDEGTMSLSFGRVTYQRIGGRRRQVRDPIFHDGSWKCRL